MPAVSLTVWSLASWKHRPGSNSHQGSVSQYECSGGSDADAATITHRMCTHIICESCFSLVPSNDCFRKPSYPVFGKPSLISPISLQWPHTLSPPPGPPAWHLPLSASNQARATPVGGRLGQFRLPATGRLATGTGQFGTGWLGLVRCYQFSSVQFLLHP
jgi:hypothetical protein